jgi:hypothetical protein
LRENLEIENFENFHFFSGKFKWEEKTLKFTIFEELNFKIRNKLTFRNIIFWRGHFKTRGKIFKIEILSG